MNVYIVNLERGYNKTHESLRVLGKDVSEAITNAQRYAKSKWYSEVEIIFVSRDTKVDVFYKSAPKKATKKRK